MLFLDSVFNDLISVPVFFLPKPGPLCGLALTCTHYYRMYYRLFTVTCTADARHKQIKNFICVGGDVYSTFIK